MPPPTTPASQRKAQVAAAAARRYRSAPQRGRAIDLVRKGASYATAAKAVNASPSSVREWCLEAGVPSPMTTLTELRRKHRGGWLAWANLRQRHPVIDRWQTFAGFLADLGPRPAGTYLVRLEEAGPYGPHNCAYLPERTLGRRRMVVYEGKRRWLTELANEAGLGRSVVVVRLKAGWSLEQALRTPAARSDLASSLPRAEQALADLSRRGKP